MKWYVYLICFACVICGVFCGVRLYTLITAESYVNGTINIQNQFTMESFKYGNTAVSFYHDIYDTTDTYSFSTDLLKVDDFDGQSKVYQITLNDYILTDTQIAAGSVNATAYIDFYDTNGNMVCSSSLNISVVFLSNKTALTLTTIGGENASFLTQYFSDNGILVKINEIKGGTL